MKEAVVFSACCQAGAGVLLCALFLGCGRIDFDPRETDDERTTGGPGVSSALVALYTFETLDASGTPDVKGGQDAICAGGCPVSSPGAVGGGAEFINDRMSVVDDGRFSLTEGFTVAAWARPDVLLAQRCVVTKPYDGGSANANVWALCVDRDGLPNFYGGGNERLTSSVAIIPGEWSHLAFTWDGQRVRLYVNTQEMAARDIAIDFDSLDLQIGADLERHLQVTAHWRGGIDDIRIYNRPLTVAELQSITQL